MKIAVAGPGQLGRVIFQAAAGERLVIGHRPLRPGEPSWDGELGYTTDLSKISECSLVCATLPAGACGDFFQNMCPLLKEDTLVLNFSTSWDIPEDLRSAWPSLHLLECKLLGSAAGLARGLPGLFLLSTEDPALVSLAREALPGLHISPGDWRSVSRINTAATRAALKAGIGLEKELRSWGCSPEMTAAAVGGLMPGTLISFGAGTLGSFAREIAEEIRRDMT